MAASRGSGTDRVLAKLRKSVEDGNFYEAHQMYRTLYFRYLCLQKYDDVLKMLLEGSHTFFKHHQGSSGADLAKLYVEVLKKAKKTPTEELMQNVAELFGLIPGSAPERPAFLSSSLEWSSSTSEAAEREKIVGHPYLHELVGQVYLEEKNYTSSRHHLMRSNNMSKLAALLIELHVEKGYRSEVDLFITQAVLQLLCFRPKSLAASLFDGYVQEHPLIGKSFPFRLPLLNFTWYLLISVQSGSLPAFTALCEVYQPSLSRDPCYRDYLDRIGQLHFGVPPPRSAGHGMLGNLMQSLMGSWDDNDSDTEENSHGPSTLSHSELD